MMTTSFLDTVRDLDENLDGVTVALAALPEEPRPRQEVDVVQ